MEIGSKSRRNVEFFYTISKYQRDWENEIMKTPERDIIDFFI